MTVNGTCSSFNSSAPAFVYGVYRDLGKMGTSSGCISVSERHGESCSWYCWLESACPVLPIVVTIVTKIINLDIVLV